MGDDQPNQASGNEQPPEDSGNRIQDLEAQLRSESDLRKEAERRLKRQDEIMRYLNEQGAELRERLERHDPRSEIIRPDELYLISRYCTGVGRDAELIEKFSKAKRQLGWTRAMFFEPLYALDKAAPDVGKVIYDFCVRKQKELSVIDMESLAMGSRTIDQPCELYTARILAALKDEDSSIDDEVSIVDDSHNAFRAYIRNHVSFYQQLDQPAAALLPLRDYKYNHSWAGLLRDIDELERKQVTVVPLLGMPSTDTATYRAYVQAMQHYEQEHKIDLSWFRILPKDLKEFCSK